MSVVETTSQSGERASIGLTKIWAEGEGVDRVSKRAVMMHAIYRAQENISRSPVTASLTVFTIGVALFLLGVFALLSDNFSVAVSRDSTEVMIHLFVKDSVSDAERSRLLKEVSSETGKNPVAVTTKAQALERFAKMLGEDGQVLEGLESENPLPASIDIRVDDPDVADILYTAIQERFGGDARVETVRYSRGSAHQLKRILRVVQVAGTIGMVLLLIITGFIIANTIKLALYSHRTEVEIMQLVGARRTAIYSPYVFEGLVQGLVGAVLGLVLVVCVYLFLADAIGKAEILQFIFPSFSFLSLRSVVFMVAAGAIVGMGGSFFAVRRFLSEG